MAKVSIKMKIYRMSAFAVFTKMVSEVCEGKKVLSSSRLIELFIHKLEDLEYFAGNYGLRILLV